MEKDKNKVVDWIIKIVLIVIIVILLLHNCALIKNKNNEKIPTGNVDIIEITCDKDDVCKTDDKQNNDSSGTTNKTDNTVPANSGDNGSEEPEPDDFFVRDKKIIWHDDVPAKIFTNSMYELEGMIAPESSNTYQFVVKNGTEYNLKYNIEFIESNPYNINMKYKLKKNNTYIVDHYVSISEINVADMNLNSKNNDTYYLEWKWISSDNDTEVGTTPNANYNLRIEVKAESIND